MITIDAFGRVLVIERTDDAWIVYDRGGEGKKRRARDVQIPPTVTEPELVQYLDDLLHEFARPGHTTVRVVE